MAKRIPLDAQRRQKLAVAMQQAGLSDVELERITGVARSTFWRIRHSKTDSMERITLLALCAVLSIPPTELVDQVELTLGLSDEFVADAKDAFGEQLQLIEEGLREEAVLEALLGMVGVILKNGSRPSKRIYEQVLTYRAAVLNSRNAA